MSAFQPFQTWLTAPMPRRAPTRVHGSWPAFAIWGKGRPPGILARKAFGLAASAAAHDLIGNHLLNLSQRPDFVAAILANDQRAVGCSLVEREAVAAASGTGQLNTHTSPTKTGLCLTREARPQACLQAAVQQVRPAAATFAQSGAASLKRRLAPHRRGPMSAIGGKQTHWQMAAMAGKRTCPRSQRMLRAGLGGDGRSSIRSASHWTHSNKPGHPSRCSST
jgi:hypothetical protein